jgi:hypothetical protein
MERKGIKGEEGGRISKEPSRHESSCGIPEETLNYSVI